MIDMIFLKLVAKAFHASWMDKRGHILILYSNFPEFA